MKEISFEDIGGVAVTMRAESSVTRGRAVGMVGKELVGIPLANEGVCGVALDVAGDGMASIQVKGFASVPYTGNLQSGWVSLVANGSGGVQKAGTGVTGHEFLLVTTDPARRTAVIML